jgi:hypothetical protein
MEKSFIGLTFPFFIFLITKYRFLTNKIKSKGYKVFIFITNVTFNLSLNKNINIFVYYTIIRSQTITGGK